MNIDDDLSIIFKAHDMFFHVSSFIDKYLDIPIGLICEQTSESLHSRFEKFRAGRMIKNKDNPNYKESFLACVVAFNGKQVWRVLIMSIVNNQNNRTIKKTSTVAQNDK